MSCTNSGGNSSSTAAKTADITVAGGGSTTCVYTNKLNQGAIKVTKTRKHAADGSGDKPHAGVSFTVNGVTKVSDANGQACFDGLNFGAYTVTETVTFHNTPLSDLTVSVNSQVTGGTSSSIVCKDSSDNTVIDKPLTNDDVSGTASDLEPDTYTCTVVIDP